MVDVKKLMPNILTLSRFPLGLLAAVLVLTGNFLTAAVVYFLGESTDYFDGILARRWNVVTYFGEAADLLADKFTILLVLLTLSILKIVTPVMFLIICARELLTTMFRQIAVRLGQPKFLKTSTGGRYTSVILREALGFMIFLTGFKPYVVAEQWWCFVWNLFVMLAWLGVLTRIFFLFSYLWRDRREGLLIIRQLLDYTGRRREVLK